MRRVFWSNSARAELKDAIQYIANEDPGSARLVRERIDRAVRLLADRPTGRPGRVTGTYEKLVLKTSYLLAYVVSDNAITILHLIHDHRDWPQGRWPEGSK